MIIVVGASRGIGLAIAEALSDAKVEVLALNRTLIECKFNQIKCDVTNYLDFENVAHYLRENNLKVSGLINVAGKASMNLSIFTPPETVMSIIQTNLAGTIFSCNTFAPFLIRNGGGFIINFSTIAVALNLEGESVYAASKAGVENYSRTLAKELSPHGIQVNVIAPGPINTDLIKSVDKDKINRIIAKQIIKKQFDVNEIVRLINFFMKTEINSITGAIINVGGV
jgi:3-oxoacyl-[acyl-carrier protein] reductase